MALDQTISFAERVAAVGYRTLQDAINDAKSLYNDKKQYQKMAGRLSFDTDWIDDFKAQVKQNKQIILSYADIPGDSRLEKLLNLGRLRAVANMVALEYGLDIPALRGTNGRFKRLPQDDMAADTYGVRYYVDCKPRTNLFWKLDRADQKELVYLAKRH